MQVMTVLLSLASVLFLPFVMCPSRTQYLVLLQAFVQELP